MTPLNMNVMVSFRNDGVNDSESHPAPATVPTPLQGHEMYVLATLLTCIRHPEGLQEHSYRSVKWWIDHSQTCLSGEQGWASTEVRWRNDSRDDSDGLYHPLWSKADAYAALIYRLALNRLRRIAAAILHVFMGCTCTDLNLSKTEEDSGVEACRTSKCLRKFASPQSRQVIEWRESIDKFDYFAP